MKTKNILKLNAIFLAFFTLLPFSASAIGQVTEPIHIKNGLKGEEIREALFLINTEKEDVEVELMADGQVKDWIKFSTDHSGTINKIMIPSGSQINAFAHIQIPKETPNGEYRGNISVIKTGNSMDDGKENISSILQKIDREITIRVSGDEFIHFAVSVIPDKYDFTAGEPLDIRFIYDNQGNTSIQPQIQLKVIKDENVIHKVIYPFPENIPSIKPSSQYEIPSIEIPTTIMENGKYLAKIEFLNNGKSYLEKEFTFSVGGQDNNFTALNMDRLKSTLWPLYLFLSASTVIFVGFLLEKRAKIIKKTLKKIY